MIKLLLRLEILSRSMMLNKVRSMTLHRNSLMRSCPIRMTIKLMRRVKSSFRVKLNTTTNKHRKKRRNSKRS